MLPAALALIPPPLLTPASQLRSIKYPDVSISGPPAFAFRAMLCRYAAV
jgi:hypothetical protein